MISVIIPKYNDEVYLNRCLSSIRRQTYKDIEIILLDDKCNSDLINKYDIICLESTDILCDGLNKAIAQANGQYIYFCSSTSILPSNLFSEFMKAQEDEVLYTDVYVLDDNNFVLKEQSLSCYGKLFNKNTISSNNLKFTDDCVMSECLFVARYICCQKDINKIPDMHIYDTQYIPVCHNKDISINTSLWRACLQDINLAQPKVNGFVSKALSDVIREKVICSEELVKIAIEVCHFNYALSYACLSPALKILWYKVVTNHDSDAFMSFKEIISQYEGESVVDLLLEACGLRGSYYNYIKNNNLSQSLFMIEESQRLSAKKDIFIENTDAMLHAPVSGLCKVGAQWYYYSDGVLDENFCGMARNDYGWWYVSNGTIDYDYVGVSHNCYGWWYITNGTINKKFTGPAMSPEGMLIYFTNGRMDKKFKGLIETEYGYKFISNGIADKEFTGLFKNNDGKWFYIQDGTVNTGFIGLVQNDYGWWYVENGTIDLTYNGFAKNNLGWCEVVNGKAKTDTAVDVFKILNEEPIRDIIKEHLSAVEATAPLEDAAKVSIGYYKDGKLGLKTILKSIGAWSKYKFKR